MNAGPNRLTDRLTAARAGGRTAQRGQSEVLGVVLLISVVIVGALTVVAGGSVILTEMQTNAEVSAAENSLAAFDSEASAVALGNSPSREVDLGLTANDGDLRYHETSWIRVDAYSDEDGTSAEVVNATLGTVEYANGDTTVAAQGGGVWRSDGQGSVMLSRPEFHYRDQTLTMPLVVVDGEPGLSGDVRITRTSEPIRHYPNEANGFLNRPDGGTVTVTVQSEYYEAWGRYFEDETTAIVSYDHPKERVTARFLVLPKRTSVEAGLIATSNNGELAITGTGAYVNSYDSSEGSYNETKAADGLVQAAGDFKASGDSLVDGDVRSGGVVDVQGSAFINGSVSYTDTPAPDATEETKIAGGIKPISGVTAVDSVDEFVDRVATEVKQTNDNDATSLVTADEFAMSGSTATLGSGRYYVHDIELDNDERLVLDTTGGDVTIVVRDYVELSKGGNITVEGDGNVQIFVESEGTTTVSPTGLGNQDVNFHVGKNAAVHVPDEKSSQLSVFGPQQFKMTIAGANNNRASFDGLVYAPGGDTGTGYLYIKQGDLYGLAVTGNLTVGQYGAAHYDYGLQSSGGIDSPFSTLKAIYVTEHQIRVASGN
ncbi:archaellin/type IV pilin N-terminal domain-containing protein [Halomicroarcula sp. GCM10025324]|uniref:DUF7289 family protein n=1 Tax=Haloarcula TaxID=2237 RepID=UPI0023E8E8CC|nr:archaellin/type IV pilin N-terminal domain-containing protein [Halomicroarcula sp. ZS-22-S1]